jgi:hypothetical protein
MSHPQEPFREIQKLLGCKRYEQPPPGYFLSFSDRVMARIETEEVQEYSSWWNWLVARFDATPVLVCTYGIAVSSLLFMGFRLSQIFEADAATTPTVAGPWLATSPGSPMLLSQEFTRASLAGLSSSWSNTKWALQDQGSSLLPAGAFALQPAGFHIEDR